MGQVEEEEEEGNEEIPCPTMLRLSFTFDPAIAGQACVKVAIILHLLAPSGALIVIMVYYISAAAATFSDFEHSSLSIRLQVSL